MNIKYDEKDFIKSPMNYTGGKYKLLPKLFRVFLGKNYNLIETFIYIE